MPPFGKVVSAVKVLVTISLLEVFKSSTAALPVTVYLSIVVGALSNF